MVRALKKITFHLSIRFSLVYQTYYANGGICYFFTAPKRDPAEAVTFWIISVRALKKITYSIPIRFR